MIETANLLSGSLCLHAQLHLPERGTPPFPAVIVCHGLGSRAANHSEFGELLTANGWAALIFDFRGHGQSEGYLDAHTVDDVGAAVAFLQSRPDIDPHRLAVRGSSMGGYFAVQAAAAFPALRAVVAICPAPEDVLAAAFERRFGPAVHDAPHHEVRQEDGLAFRVDVPGFTDYLRRHRLDAAARVIAPRALLLVHAKGDESIDFQHTVRLYGQAREPKRLLLLEGGSHGSAQHDPTVHHTTLAWLRMHATR